MEHNKTRLGNFDSGVAQIGEYHRKLLSKTSSNSFPSPIELVFLISCCHELGVLLLPSTAYEYARYTVPVLPFQTTHVSQLDR